MEVLLSPQRSHKKIKYEFENEKVTAKYNGKTDVFDFADMPNGAVDIDKVQTKLDINPIVSAKRKEGTLYVEVINFIDENATEEERFPDWKEV